MSFSGAYFGFVGRRLQLNPVCGRGPPGLLEGGKYLQ